MSSYTLESLTSENIGHVLASLGLASALAQHGGRIHWESADAPSSPTLTIDASPAAINSAIIEAIRALVDDWNIILPQCFTRIGPKKKTPRNDRDGASVEEREVESGWIGCDRDSLYDIFDRLPERLRARLAPWVSILAVEPENKKYTNKPRTQLSKTKYTEFFTQSLLESVEKVDVSIGVLKSLESPLCYLETMPWSDKTVKTGYDAISTLKDGGRTQSTIGATLAHPLVEALILLGLEVASLRPSIKMPRSRITRSVPKRDEELVVPLWTKPLSACEIEAYLYDCRAERFLVVPFAANGKNIVPLPGTFAFERVGGTTRPQRRSKGGSTRKIS